MARADNERFPLPVRVAELDRTIQKQMGNSGTPNGEEDPRWLAIHLAADRDAADCGLDQAFASRQLRRPETVVLLDGLDEALNEGRRRVMAGLFAAAAKHYGQCRFIVTTRPGAYEGEARADGFALETIAPLTVGARKAFFVNWARCVRPGDAKAAEELRQDLEAQASATQEVREMADNPMMLTALACIHWNEKRLPQDRCELYASILGWLARTRERREGRLPEKKCLEILAALAFGMQTWPMGRLKQADRDHAVQILMENAGLARRAAGDFLEQEELDSGIIVSRDGELVEFRHLTFQEYLAAREVLENRSDTELEEVVKRERQRYSVEWRGFLRLLALQMRPRKAQRLYGVLLDGAGDSLADRARTVALIRTMAWDRREKEEEIEEGRYVEFVREMAGLFEGKADGQGLDLWSRGEAAEAWELMGDISGRLCLPTDERYWVPVTEKFALGRCPVTVFEYGKYLEEAAAAAAPPDWEKQERFPLRPVVRVSCTEAEEYCRWCSRV